ncbi:MAG: MFS transporter [Pseudomonadota bacterium]
MRAHSPEQRAAALVSLCFTMAVMAWGIVFYGHSFYLQSLTALGRFSTAEVSGAIGFSFWCGIPAGIVAGRMLTRYPPFRVIAFGVCTIAAALLLLPAADGYLLLYLAFALFGIGYPCLSTTGISGTLNYYLRERYATRLSMALTGASVGGAAMVPVLVWLRDTSGLATTLLLVAVVMALVLLPFGFALARQPAVVASSPSTPGPRIRPAALLRSRVFLAITVSGACMLGGQVAFLSHQVPLLSTYLDDSSAAFGVSITAGTAVAGRFLAGALAERFDVARLCMCAAAVQAAGMCMLYAATTPLGLFAGSAVGGFVVGAIVMLPPLLVRARFGSERYSEIYGYTNVGLYLGAGLGPVALGWLREADGDYSRGLMLIVAAQVAAVLALLAANRRDCAPAGISPV